MIQKYIYWIGLLSCLVLIVVCFLPWAYYADINKTFTGFFTEQNHYGKPGKFLVFLSLVIFVLMCLPKLWAKRANLFFSAVLLSYAVKTFILFSGCYNTYCPQKKMGIYCMLFTAIFILMATIFPNMKLQEKR